MTNSEQTTQDNTNKEESIQKTKKKGTWDIRPYLAVGLTVILVVFICMAIFFFIYRFQGFSEGIAKVINSLRGIIFGLILAYLLSPGMKMFERRFSKRLRAKGELTLKQKTTVRALSVTCAMAIFLAVIAVLIILIVPQLVSSIQDLIVSLEDKVTVVMSWIDRLNKGGNGELESKMEQFLGDATKALTVWVQERLFGVEGDLITSLTAGVYNMVKTVFDCIVGVIVAVYVLMRKETFVGQFKKIVYAIFKPRLGNMVMEVVMKADDVFGGFFIGKIIDSIIIGFICFAGLSIMKMPYVVLISVIVGVTNIIPFFGPYIGAIPSAILILLVNPIQALYFLIFIVILQQVDGNIIGPKILGNTTGLSPFWVIFSCLLFGGTFGIVGMIFGVPIFAIIYYIIKRVAEHFLGKRELPRGTGKYVNLGSVDVQTNEIKDVEERKTVLQFEKVGKGKKKDNE